MKQGSLLKSKLKSPGYEWRACTHHHAAMSHTIPVPRHVQMSRVPSFYLALKTHSKNQEGVRQHVIHCHVCMHCTECTNQVAHKSRTCQLDKALDVAGGRLEYEKLLPKQRKAVEAFVSVFVCLPSGYRKSFCHSYCPSFVLFSSVRSQGSAPSPHTQHRIDTAP